MPWAQNIASGKQQPLSSRESAALVSLEPQQLVVRAGLVSHNICSTISAALSGPDQAGLDLGEPSFSGFGE